MERQRRSFLVEDSFDRYFMGVGESVPIFGVSVQFGCGVFECDGLDGFGPFYCECIALIVHFFMFLEGQFPLIRLVKAGFLGVFIHFGAYASNWFFLRSSDFDLEVADHSTNTIISKVRKLNKPNIITTTPFHQQSPTTNQTRPNSPPLRHLAHSPRKP